MADAILSFFGLKKELFPNPPSVTITGVRIPADGTPAYLAPLNTISTASTTGGTDTFLFHIPDLRPFWKTKNGWEFRDIERLELRQQQQPPQNQDKVEHHLQQWDSLMEQQQDRLAHSYRLIHCQRQRQNTEELRRIVLEHHSSCSGIYYIFWSLDQDNLPVNPFVPTWINEDRYQWYGDVFLVKMAPYEYGGYGWALYEDIDPEFLDLLAEGPLKH
ncbi:MAG: hypothetical protein M1822_009597 [Bathelium mastoideum]|nr:MAG: hypothetical protein M1822_009597 [Bathelium mastoideum]